MNYLSKLPCIGICYTILLFFSVNTLGAQVVYEFNSQEDLDLFSPNSTTIEGDIYINGDDISNLFPLSLLQHITGNLIIGDTLNTADGNDILENLEGLNNLLTIGNNLQISGNPALNSLYGLHNLETIGKDIILRDLALLNSIDALQLTDNQINGDFELNNTALYNLQGLHNIQIISGSITLISNQNLGQIDLAHLTHINGGLRLINNGLITDFTDLESLEFLGADLVLIVNNNLTTLDGLEALSIIDGDLMITANGPLSNLDGLSNVEMITDSLIVNYNSNLASCCGIFPSLIHENMGYVSIVANATNCNSELEIIDYCSTVDTDEDGVADIEDNCPLIANAEQIDSDNDGFGQVCDCDDNLDTVHPNAIEIFNNDIDDDCDGEVDEGSPTVPDCSPFSASISNQTNVSCAGGNDGAISLHFEGATMPLTCNWAENGGNTQNLENLAAGTYAVTLTDANDCSTSLSTVISEPLPLTLEAVTTIANCEENNGEISLSVNGGTAPYSHAWSHGLGNFTDLQELAPDSYHVTVTDDNGCQNTTSAIVLEQECPDFLLFQFTEFELELLPSSEVDIRFTTVGENSNGTFFLEHSVSGTDFQTIENQIVGNGFSEFSNQYTSQHSSPEIGYNYYRIMYLDADNSAHHSAVKEIFNHKSNGNFIFPNPSSRYVNLEIGEEEAKIMVNIYTETGIEILNKEFQNNGDLLRLDMNNYPAGIYFLRVNSENSLLMTEKIIKVN